MFQVGKKVICIKDQSRGVVKKGQVFELLDIRNFCCDTSLLIDVPFRKGYNHTRCADCCKKRPIGEMWLSSTLFAPYDDSLSEMTADELIESLEIELVPNF